MRIKGLEPVRGLDPELVLPVLLLVPVLMLLPLRYRARIAEPAAKDCAAPRGVRVG